MISEFGTASGVNYDTFSKSMSGIAESLSLSFLLLYSKTCVKRHLSKKIGFKHYRLMQVKIIAEWEHSAILSTFIKL